MPTSRSYGQAKMHKPRFPVHTVASCSGSLLYNLNKYIASILKASSDNSKGDNNNAKNSITFPNYRNASIEDDKIVVSFDVTSLYRKCPIIDTHVNRGWCY